MKNNVPPRCLHIRPGEITMKGPTALSTITLLLPLLLSPLQDLTSQNVVEPSCPSETPSSGKNATQPSQQPGDSLHVSAGSGVGNGPGCSSFSSRPPPDTTVQRLLGRMAALDQIDLAPLPLGVPGGGL